MDNGESSYRRFLDGDDEGFVEIIKEYKDGLMLYLNNYVQNIYTAEDLVEDTFVKIVTKKPNFSGKSSFKTWLYAIGRNTATDFVRRHSKISTVSVEDETIILRDEENAEREYLREEQKIYIHEALKKINPDYRKVLHLIYFEGFNITEVSAILKKSYKQTENLIYQAKKSLKAKLEKEGFIYEEL